MNEKEAIEYIEQFIGIKKEYKCKPIKVKTLNNTREAIETVLNLLEKKDKEIQFQKEINKIEQDRHKQTEKTLKGQLQKKDEIIDEMAGYIVIDNIEITDDVDVCEYVGKSFSECGHLSVKCKDCIKQYFERKLENGN